LVSLRRIGALSLKEFIHLRNDWWLPAFMLVGGVLELLLIGWATSRPIANLPMMVLDRDMSPESRTLISRLENTGTFAAAENVYSEETIRDAMDRGSITIAVIIPRHYGERIAWGMPTLSVILNGAESIPATEALRAVEGVVGDLGEEITVERLNLDPAEFEGFIPSMRVWFNETLSEALYTTPAELGLMLEFTVMLFAALSFSRERELGTLEQLLVMPYSTLELIMGKAFPVMLVGMTQFLLMLGMVNVFFGVPVRGSLVLLLVLALFYLSVEMAKGMVISVIARTQHQAFLIVLLVGMADFMFTGYAAPVESMPRSIQLVSEFIPAHHWLDIMRGVMLKSSGPSVLWPQILGLILLGTVIGAFSFRFVRRALN
jgi:ABC-2 type transport system permease protein